MEEKKKELNKDLIDIYVEAIGEELAKRLEKKDWLPAKEFMGIVNEKLGTDYRPSPVLEHSGYIKDLSSVTFNKVKENKKSESKLEMLSKAINGDFEWAMSTSLIFENHGVDDPETIGFLKGVTYCTEMYLDILEKEGRVKYE